MFFLLPRSALFLLADNLIVPPSNATTNRSPSARKVSPPSR